MTLILPAICPFTADPNAPAHSLVSTVTPRR